MKLHTQTIIRRILYAGLMLITACVSSQAATVYINQNPLAVSGGSLVAAAQLRAGTGTNWDMALSNGRDFEGANARRADLAATFSLPARNYTFTLAYKANEGFQFTVRDTQTGQTTTQAWGTFSTPVAGDVVPTLGGRAPVLPFDAIQIDARATAGRASTTFSNLVFTSADLNTAGSFYGGTINNRNFFPDNAGVATQDLLADVNLGAYSWKITGDVTFMRSLAGMGGPSEVSLTINVANVGGGSAVPAPEPSCVTLFAGVAGLALARRRRHA